MAEQVERDQQKTVSQRVADALRSEIQSGRLAVGMALPTYRQIAADHGVATNTAMAAVRLLRDEGLVAARPNATGYVRDRSSDKDHTEELQALRSELADLRAEVRTAGASLSTVESRLAAAADRLRRFES